MVESPLDSTKYIIQIYVRSCTTRVPPPPKKTQANRTLTEAQMVVVLQIKKGTAYKRDALVICLLLLLVIS